MAVLCGKKVLPGSGYARSPHRLQEDKMIPKPEDVEDVRVSGCIFPQCQEFGFYVIKDGLVCNVHKYGKKGKVEL